MLSTSSAASAETVVSPEPDAAQPEGAPSLPTALASRPAAPLWRAFWDVCRTPRSSKHEAALRDLLIERARKAGAQAIVDPTGNLVVRLPATPGKASLPILALHAHLDMVCDQVPGTGHDFSRDPICPRIDGNAVRADRTTLGADDGIGAAALLALIDDRTIPHGPLELLFTIDEEGDFTGAIGLRKSALKAGLLINLDSEENREFNIGCAGGQANTFELQAAPEQSPACIDENGFRIQIRGIAGGHSGVDIFRGGANAIHLLGRFLCRAAALCNVRLMSVSGGTFDTAIPREIEAIVVVPGTRLAAFRRLIQAYGESFREAWKKTDPELRVCYEPLPLETTVGRPTFDLDVTKRLGAFLREHPVGVLRWSPRFPDQPELSTNPGVLRTASGVISLVSHLQSSFVPAQQRLSQRLKRIAERHGLKMTAGEPYPPWAAAPDSDLVKRISALHVRLFGVEPKLKVVHAGIECGVFASTFPGMQMVSFGPAIHGAHTPEECVEIASVDEFWQLLKGCLLL